MGGPCFAIPPSGGWREGGKEGGGELERFIKVENIDLMLEKVVPILKDVTFNTHPEGKGDFLSPFPPFSTSFLIYIYIYIHIYNKIQLKSPPPGRANTSCAPPRST